MVGLDDLRGLFQSMVLQFYEHLSNCLTSPIIRVPAPNHHLLFKCLCGKTQVWL